ncbi:MAG TPA: DNA polymerase ligase N-terminal domain-containing protein [Chlamydiales bacterium]|nr:DNA polymerase ligase N-terminal domain-containing protein [Chlamydiales bacterium]
MGLAAYRKKRTFKKTPEPKGKISKPSKKRLYVVQRHDASHLHYDFRLEIGGVLKSWALPKGLPVKLNEKRLAVMTEDHPKEYAYFEGEIPKGNYGAGTVKIWDRGKYTNLKRDKNGKELPLKTCIQKGQLSILLEGKRYKGAYALIHFRDKNWLMMKLKTRKI